MGFWDGERESEYLRQRYIQDVMFAFDEGEFASRKLVEVEMFLYDLMTCS